MGPEGLTGADEDLDSQTPAARQVLAGPGFVSAPSVKDQRGVEPKIGGKPPNHKSSILIGFSIINHPCLGYLSSGIHHCKLHLGCLKGIV